MAQGARQPRAVFDKNNWLKALEQEPKEPLGIEEPEYLVGYSTEHEAAWRVEVRGNKVIGAKAYTKAIFIEPGCAQGA